MNIRICLVVSIMLFCVGICAAKLSDERCCKDHDNYGELHIPTHDKLHGKLTVRDEDLKNSTLPIPSSTSEVEVEWSKTFGGSSYDGAHSVQQTSDGGYIIAGDTCSYGSCKSDVWLIKVKERSTNLPPVASFTFSPTSPTVGQTITFDASSSYDPDGSIVLYQWNFGDGNVTATTSPSITHTYSSAGTYTVTLTVRDDRGLTSTKSVTIEVSEEIGQLLIQLS